MFEGRILADLPQERADEESVGLLMAGLRRRRRERPRAMDGASPRLRPPPVLLAILISTLVGGALVLVSGHNPLHAYAEIVEGSLSLDSLPDTLNWATPLVGMTLVAAIPLRGGMLNLGGDGQLVIGGLIGALLPLVLPGPGALVSHRGARRRGVRRRASTPRSPLGAKCATASRC